MNAPVVPSPPAVEIRNLHHRFGGHQALNGVDFNVEPKSIHGFVGPNGAGKTTTLRVLATLLKPQIGTVRVMGLSVTADTENVRRRIGFMPDHFSMYRQMTVFEYLDFFGAAYGLTQAKRDEVIAGVLELTDMAGRRDTLIKGLSRGMQQRVSLARVLVHDPDLLLLDEPASGLDPRARIELMDILRELRNLGKTIFISSHILSELADLCDSVTILDRGKVKYTGSMEGLLTDSGDPGVHVVVRLEAPCPAAPEAAAAVAGVLEVEEREDGLSIGVRHDGSEGAGSRLLSALIAAGANVRSMEPEKRHLNQAFMDLTEAGVRT